MDNIFQGIRLLKLYKEMNELAVALGEWGGGDNQGIKLLKAEW